MAFGMSFRRIVQTRRRYREDGRTRAASVF
jgi:hypothetical protein